MPQRPQQQMPRGNYPQQQYPMGGYPGHQGAPMQIQGRPPYDPDQADGIDEEGGHGAAIALVVMIILLLVVAAGGAFMIISSQPQTTHVVTVNDLKGKDIGAMNDKMLSDEEIAAIEAGNSIGPIPMNVDKVMLPFAEETGIAVPGTITLSQIVGTERIKIADFPDVLPNVPIGIQAMSNELVQNGTYEIRMSVPVLLEDGRRLSFHAYIIDYRWERNGYIASMEPSLHDMYVLAEGEEPDFAELIESGVAQRTKNDQVRKGDTLVQLNENTNENVESNNNASTNSNGNGTGNSNNVNANASQNEENANSNSNNGNERQQGQNGNSNEQVGNDNQNRDNGKSSNTNDNGNLQNENKSNTNNAPRAYRNK